MLRERVMQRIPDRKSMVFRNIVAEAQRSGEINPQLSPDLLFISLMALLMVPHAAATIRGRLSSSPPLDNATIDRHVLSLLTHGLSPSEAGQPPKADVL